MPFLGGRSDKMTMKTAMIRCTAVVAAALLSACSSNRQPQGNPWGLPVDYNPLESFDAKELRSLADDTDLDRAERRRFLWLILRAAAEKDGDFRDLLDRQDLRDDREFDLALSGYDYAINGNEAALDHILAEDRKLPRGGDHTTIQVMGFLDEWDRTLRAIRTHEKHADGAGGIAVTSFWTQRSVFFPDQYERHRHPPPARTKPNKSK